MRIGAASTAILNVALLSFFIFQGLQSPFRKLGGSSYPHNAALPGHDPVTGDIGEFAAFDPETMTSARAIASTIIAIVAVLRFEKRMKSRFAEQRVLMKFFGFKAIIGLNALQTVSNDHSPHVLV